jgi:G3E family GTPase
VPISFVAGYLGAGKTTLINTVLATTDRPIAIVVNDVGEINIDARLISRHDGDTIELTDGCVCCSLVDGFGAAFDQIRARPSPPDHVIVELSGVAEPARVLPWGRSAGFRLDGVITLVGADQFDGLMERSDIAATITAQVTAADLVVVTKTDLVEPATAAATVGRLRTIVSDAPIVTAADPTLPSALLRIGGRRPGGTTDVPDATLFDRHIVERHPLPRPVDPADIERLLDELPADVVRAKGIAEGSDGKHWCIQVVGRRRSITHLPPVEDEPPTDLVVIRLAH